MPSKYLAATLLALCAVCGCRAYDSSLLVSGGDSSSLCGDGVVDNTEFCDSAIEAGMPGACPTACESDDACEPKVLVGSGCKRRCMAAHVTAARNGDGCCPELVSAAEDDDCGSCGDGVVGPSESCDPPDSCPSEAHCRSEDACIAAVFSGKAKHCTARCELKPITTCMDGDGCCPNGCAGEDDDCSATCGDGIVDAKSHETCEPSNEAAQCPTRCDDGDPCTRDVMLGSATTCNAHCTHTTITNPEHEDGCCPRAAHALNDSDCAPSCGNGVTEPGEECDWGELCNDACRLRFHASLAHRYRFTGSDNVAADSVGGANATIVKGTLGADGLRLAGGNSGQYVDLPNGLLSSLTSATIETWLTWSGASTTDHWQRIFDFGNNQGGEGKQSGAATSFLFLTTSNYEGGVGAYVNFTSTAGDTRNDRFVTTSGVLRDGQPHHVAVVFDGQRHSMQLYVDGQARADINGLGGNLSDIDDRNAWIGRSNWGDDDLHATVREFRIYRSALSAAEVRSSYQRGSEPPRTTTLQAQTPVR